MANESPCKTKLNRNGEMFQSGNVILGASTPVLCAPQIAAVPPVTENGGHEAAIEQTDKPTIDPSAKPTISSFPVQIQYHYSDFIHTSV